MLFHAATLLNAVLAVCTSSAWAVSAVPVDPAPVLPSAEFLPMEKMLAEQWEEAVPRTLEDCDRYLAAGRLANDPCALKTKKDGLGLVPDAAWKEKEGWKALQVHLDGTLSFILFDEAGIPEPLHPGVCRVMVDQRSSTVVRLGYGEWEVGRARALYRSSYCFDPNGKRMREICDVSFPDGRNFNEWTFSHKPEGLFACRDESWAVTGLQSYFRHTWNVRDGRLLWWKVEEIPLPGKELPDRRARGWHGVASLPKQENEDAVFVSIMYFPERGGEHPSLQINENVESKEFRCLFYDGSGHGTSLLVYRDGVLDRKQSWFFQPRMDAAAMAAREKKARNAEERRMLKLLYRFAPYAEKEAEKASGDGVARLG